MKLPKYPIKAPETPDLLLKTNIYTYEDFCKKLVFCWLDGEHVSSGAQNLRTVDYDYVGKPYIPPLYSLDIQFVVV